MLLSFIVSGCLLIVTSTPALAADGILQFKSGFEGTTKVNQLRSDYSDIVGLDGSLGDWSSLQNGTYSNLDWVKFSYAYLQGGQIDIVSDPTGGNNHVLRLQNTGTRTQWQMNQIPTYWKDDGQPNKFSQQFYRYRIYIPSNITTVPSYSSRAPWYMIWESHTWNSSPFPGAEQTRHGIYLQKDQNSDLWYFNVIQERPEGCHYYDGPGPNCTTYWDNSEHQNIAVPFDQWFTLDVFFRYNETNGRFYVAITKEGSQRQLIADFQGKTKYEQKLHDQMIIKLYHDASYTSKLGTTRQYYDDLEIWSDFPPGYFSGGTSTPTPTPKIGDANGDSKVDGIDYSIWLNNYNQLINGVSNGDFNNSGKVDGVDYSIWLNNYNT